VSEHHRRPPISRRPHTRSPRLSTCFRKRAIQIPSFRRDAALRAIHGRFIEGFDYPDLIRARAVLESREAANSALA
jgi:hypothetical protein